jgi:hypothetical protein
MECESSRGGEITQDDFIGSHAIDSVFKSAVGMEYGDEREKEGKRDG